MAGEFAVFQGDKYNLLEGVILSISICRPSDQQQYVLSEPFNQAHTDILKKYIKYTSTNIYGVITKDILESELEECYAIAILVSSYSPLGAKTNLQVLADTAHSFSLPLICDYGEYIEFPIKADIAICKDTILVRKSLINGYNMVLPAWFKPVKLSKNIRPASKKIDKVRDDLLKALTQIKTKNFYKHDELIKNKELPTAPFIIYLNPGPKYLSGPDSSVLLITQKKSSTLSKKMPKIISPAVYNFNTLMINKEWSNNIISINLLELSNKKNALKELIVLI